MDCSRLLTNPVSTLFGASGKGRDPRISRLVQEHGPVDAVLLGYPDDRGIAAGGGRTGAAQGPAALRAALLEYGTTWNLAASDDLERLSLADGGDVTAQQDTPGYHRAVAEAVEEGFAMASVLIGIGGGHDCTYGGLLGTSRALGGQLGGVNIDAHLDVRPITDNRITSGSPFRLAIEDPAAGLDPARFSVLGADPRAGTRGSHAFLSERGGHVVTRRQLGTRGADEVMAEALAIAGSGPIFVSLDLDALAAAHAPGVSAPSPDGLSPREALDLVFVAGADPRVRYFDIVELSPPHDPSGLTARLAAALLVEFLHGLAARIKRR